MSYQAPVKEMRFVINELADLAAIARQPGMEDASPDTVQAVLDESAKFTTQVIAPLNHTGDVQGCRLIAGEVITPSGFKEAFARFAASGWQGLAHPTQFGGAGLPKLVSTACNEMLNSANMSFALCPLLTDGAIEALLTAGSKEQQDYYLPRLISGEWTGTMNLTEPQAGSDLSLLRSRAEPIGDGRYRVFGSKIFITFGQHDMASNIVHLVLARVPGAPEGVKGISLFVVPKFLHDADGRLNLRNDIECLSLEHKLGIRGSPTAILQFGDHGGAIGTLIGEENRGLEYMFIMMNSARYAVGMQGVAIAERARQQATAYARVRVQGRALDSSHRTVAIIEHPDVKRMLLDMRALTEGSRAAAYMTAAHSDLAAHHADPQQRRQHQALYEFLVPIIKGWCTEMAQEVTSLGIQVHGGMGFIEETGAAQHFRDARILPIYEGTTAIQANDLIGRKTVRDQGAVARLLARHIEETENQLLASGNPDARAIHGPLRQARLAFEAVVDHVVEHHRSSAQAVYAEGVAYLTLCGILVSGWQLARALLISESRLAEDRSFYGAKIVVARYFAGHYLTRAAALRDCVLYGGETVNRLATDDL
ncbi:acyl-CoA dehydrogenase [Pseudomonas sp. H11T01]|uniref:acyl-CoA dehydrogenase n=1 Tax=Pseudomonas sp. H11T01 TaxID=3402749 RepID=UPI003ACBB7D8